MQPGDRVFIYHTGGESAIVGLGEVASEARADPKDAKLAVIDVKYVTHLDPPTTLSEIKATHLFDDWALVRQGRLSTMEAPSDFVKWIKKRYPKMDL
jgi:predicted RNA-binding protein with PUA-like domain